MYIIFFLIKRVPEKLRGEALQASGVDTSSAASLELWMGVYDLKHWPRYQECRLQSTSQSIHGG